MKKSLSPRLESLSGRKIGIINNTKHGGEILWPYVAEALQKQLPDAELRTWRIHFAFPPSRKEPLLREVVDYSDAVIALMGD
ncbi:hypothetical protein ACFLWN_02925 [Chloroflexota bacterium]